MSGYWITFEDGGQGYCEGQNEYDAKTIAEHVAGKKVHATKTLPYPATPIIWQLDHPVHGKTPDFCYSPRECAGRTACPKARSCTE